MPGVAVQGNLSFPPQCPRSEFSYGGGAAYAATRLVQKELFGILPTDAVTMALSALGIATVAILSGYLPARRATAIDPMRALRWE